MTILKEEHVVAYLNDLHLEHHAKDKEKVYANLACAQFIDGQSSLKVSSHKQGGSMVLHRSTLWQ